MSLLLIVDDDPAVLGALELLFKDRGYDVLATDSPQSALDLLNGPRTPTVSVIISDYRMPGMTGIEFLQRVRQITPDAKRILLTGKSDLVTAVDAVNQGGLYRFLMKPCSHELLLEAVEDAFFAFNSTQENRRLADDLRQANAELRELSNTLEARVEQAARELRDVIYFDRLTGLPSRELMQDRLEFAMHSARRGGHSVMVIYIGIGNFRLVNESLGHQAGNQLLCAFSKRLEMVLWEGDSAGRMDGDQFCLIINNTGVSVQPNDVLKRLLDTLKKPFMVNGREIYLHANLGISMYPGDGDTPLDLLNHADVAMHQVKKEVDADYRFYSEELNRQSGERLLLHSQVRKALENSEFVMYYQPRVHIDSGDIIGVEALIRWRHPDHGLLAPAEFLPLLEETGLICPVGEWVLGEVCRTAVRWQQLIDKPLHVAVNVSPVQLKSGHFPRTVAAAVKDNDLDLSKAVLELEITESVLLTDLDRVREQLEALWDMGIKIAIDDFGTGYSSLGYLIKLPIHYLKIDRAFVVDVTRNRDAKAIVQAITSLARSLRMQVVAEGIENSDQLEMMYNLDCQEFQGFLFSKPISAEEMLDLLKTGMTANFLQIAN
ncbi:MAG TPA: EAL domain-containing protein [Gammaproteobacteria bacterium]